MLHFPGQSSGNSQTTYLYTLNPVVVVEHCVRSAPITVQASPFALERPHMVASVLAHHNALQEVLPSSAMVHAKILSHNELVGAITGADISAMIRASFHAGAIETDPTRIRHLIDEAFLGVR